MDTAMHDSMSEHLPDVELSPEQEARVIDVLVAMVGMTPRAARLIVHLQDENKVLRQWHREAVDAHSNVVDELIQLRTEVARLETHIIERQPLKVTDTSSCPVVFEKGQLGACTACGRTFECGARVPSTTEAGPK